MSTYLWSGKDRNGQKFVLGIQAETAGQAKHELESRGCTELELHSDEVVHELTKQLADAHAIPAEKQLEYRDQGAGTWREFVGRTFREQAWIQAVLFLILCLEIYRGKAWPAALLLTIMVLLFALRLYQARPVVEFAKLYSAREWHRWPEVLTRVTRLEKIGASRDIGIPSFEFARCRAHALAGMGRISDAVSIFSRATTDGALPEWLYLQLLASIYDVAKDYDKAIELSRQAIQSGPQNQSAHIDLAFRLAFHKQDAQSARAALATIEQCEMTDLAKPFLALCEGAIADLEGSPHEAKRHLDDALRTFERFSRLHLIEGNIYLTKALLCCVCAQLREFTSARTYFEDCEEFLRAIGADELLRRCEAAVCNGKQASSTSTGQPRAE